MSKFSELAGTVAKHYQSAGMSAKNAERIGAAVAAKQGIKKLGKKKFFAKAAAGRRAANA